MKKLVFIAFVLISTVSFGQKNKNKAAHISSQLGKYKKVYAMALQYGDASVALNSLYFIIAEEGDKSPYKDSLAFLYFDMASFAQCERIASEIVGENQDSIAIKQKLSMLEIMSLSQASLGKTKEAISSFELLLSKTGEMYHAYRLAELQYTYKRIGEALISITTAEKLKNSMQAPVNIDMGNKQIQQVKLEAAIQNLKGYILLQEYPDRKAEAIAALTKALELQPDFVLAKNNLAFANGAGKEEQPKEKK